MYLALLIRIFSFSKDDNSLSKISRKILNTTDCKENIDPSLFPEVACASSTIQKELNDCKVFCFSF